MVEPVQGEGGYIVPPADFLPMLREVTEKYSVPLILDEVQSGVGRTGKIWASEHSHVSPDIMCISKSIGGGIPTSMIVYREEYDRELPGGFHFGTYRGNQLALAAGTAILKYLKETDLLSRVTNKGEYIKKRLNESMELSHRVGEVRGIGFMIGVEMVKDRKSREPDMEFAQMLKTELFKSGLLMHTCGHYSNVLRHMAPLTIEDELIDRGVEIFLEGLRKIS
jgi:4-aminobutyrate aminotransferase and related aminotransferases